MVCIVYKSCGHIGRVFIDDLFKSENGYFGFEIDFFSGLNYWFWKPGKSNISFGLVTQIFKPAIFFSVFNFNFWVWLLSSLPAWSSFSQLITEISCKLLSSLWV